MTRGAPARLEARRAQAARWRIAALVSVLGIVFALVATSGGLSSDRVRDAIDPLGAAAVPAFILAAPC